MNLEILNFFHVHLEKNFGQRKPEQPFQSLLGTLLLGLVTRITAKTMEPKQEKKF
jgi:hypothetical protein